MRKRLSAIPALAALAIAFSFGSCSNLAPKVAPTPEVMVLSVNPMAISVSDTAAVSVSVKLLSRNNANARINFTQEVFFAPFSRFTDTLWVSPPQAMCFYMSGGDTDSISFSYSKGAVVSIKSFMDSLGLGTMDSRVYLTGASEVEPDNAFTVSYGFSYVN